MEVAGRVSAHAAAAGSAPRQKGKREYVQILRLLEHFSLTEVQASLQQALQLQALSFDAVKHLVLDTLAPSGTAFFTRRPVKRDGNATIVTLAGLCASDPDRLSPRKRSNSGISTDLGRRSSDNS
ncbi:MAG: hypothetical protein ACR2JB_05215 [Bryobacteraceae bacterium]